MAIPKPTLVLSLLALLFSIASLSAHAGVSIRLAGPDIAAICDKSLDRQFCLNYLQSTPGISAADLKGSGLIVLNSARAEASGTESYVKGLLAKAANPKQKEAYKTCLSNYDDAVGNIEAARESMSGGDYNGANIQASAAQENADTCDGGVKGTELSGKNQHLVKVLGIVLIIANRLLGG
ncbi:unnamed protein product [Linum trigynum]|uniref:Pectinesterase inhibitor domain-containing protein n=1 Tax=Linum trigynum TaxID=586398 RepID=A0AAV2ED81_9ROSI